MARDAAVDELLLDLLLLFRAIPVGTVAMYFASATAYARSMVLPQIGTLPHHTNPQASEGEAFPSALRVSRALAAGSTPPFPQ